MSNVVTMEGTRLMDAPRLLEYLSEREDIQAITLVITTKNGMNEVIYTRQSIADLIMSSVILKRHVEPLIDDFIQDPE